MGFLRLILLLGCVGLICGELSSRNYKGPQKFHSYYTLWWDIEGEEIFLKVEVKRVGWVGFGIAEPTSGGMTGADIMHASIEGGEATIWDRYVMEEHNPPTVDHCEDWELVGALEEDGNTIIEFKRLLDTKDPQDRPITPGDTRIIAAWGGHDSFEYHGPSNRFMATIDFFNPTKEVNNTTVITRQVQFNNYVPAREQVEMCTTFPFYFDSPKHLVRIDSIVNIDVIQAVLYGCNAATESVLNYTTSRPCSEPLLECSQILWVWTEGIESFELDANAGYPFENSTNGYQYILIETLYHNEDSAYYDNSRFTFSFDEPRAHAAGVLQLGNPFLTKPGIKAKETETTFQYTCSSACTNKWSNDITVFGDSFYLLNYGVRTLSVLNGNPEETLQSIEFYSGNTNQITPVSRTIKKGDRIDTFCVYNSASNLEEIEFGLGQDEITCFEYLYYYPRLQNDLSVCSFYQGKTWCGKNQDDLASESLIEETNPVSAVPLRERSFGVNSTHCDLKAGVVNRNTGALIGVCLVSTLIVVGMTVGLLWIALRSKDDQLVHRQYSEEH
jgi:hypothetical protein